MGFLNRRMTRELKEIEARKSWMANGDLGVGITGGYFDEEFHLTATPRDGRPIDDPGIRHPRL